MRYRRVYAPGASYFFTVVTANRRPIFASEQMIGLLRQAFRRVKHTRPFIIDAIVVLPDHLHCIWTLPPHDADYSTRWKLIKAWISKHQLRKCAHPHHPLWQKRFWEHLIRDEKDWRRHMDYIHYNPVKHGYVSQVRDWPYSSFDAGVGKGWYEADWGSDVSKDVLEMDIE